MISLNELQVIIKSNATGERIDSSDIIYKIQNKTFTAQDIANYLNTISTEILANALNKAKNFFEGFVLSEGLANKKQVTDLSTDIVGLGLMIFYLVISTSPSIAGEFGDSAERSARAILSAYSLFIGKKKGVKASHNALKGQGDMAIDDDNSIAAQRPARIEESMNIKKLKLLIVEQRAEMAMQSQPPMDMTGEPDYEGGMARNELKTAARDAMALVDRLKESDQLPAWCQSKITMASEYIQTVKEYLESEVDNEETFEYETQE